uniref:Major facilitator superfamily (MFS) profile domain-containing protein n=1 Tax=Leersia perrieri TaxID=77586 RepID=A0A0D9W5P9_9ORYZ
MAGTAEAARDYGGGVTAVVVVNCLIAASCGLIFGYDIGVTGGVTQMQSFLTKFFPEVVRGMHGAKRDAYCRYDNQLLTAFTSSLYIAGALSSLVASRVTRKVGRQAIMLTGGALFLVGSAFNAGAVNIAMLIIGRMLLGVGVGFTTQAAPLYLAETAPTRWRGAFTTAYHFFLVVGTLAATVTNYFTDRIPGWGWRVSLGVAGVPAAVIVVGALFVPDTPSSLVLRGHKEKARASLQRIRGADADVDAEFKDIVRAVDEARRNDEGAFRRLRGEGYRHYLVMVVAIPTFFDLTGMIVIAVFAPVLFRTIGFSSQKAILGSLILNLVNLSCVVFSSIAIDRVGRRVLFITGGIFMMLCQVAVSWIMAEHLGKHHAAATMAKNYATGLVALMCLYTASFGMSWGPLKWVVPSEIYPVEIRSAGQALTMSIALTLSFTQTQVFISMLCAMKYAIFLFYAGWVLTMTIFIALFLPETKGVPLEAMRSVWAKHWYWKRFVNDPKLDAQLQQCASSTIGFVAGGGTAQDYGGGVTFSVVVTCLMAAFCGLIFGYDTGVTGGVTQMESFLSKFFPEVLRGMKSPRRDAYCKYDNQWLTAFTSSLFIAGTLSSLVASRVTRAVGRQAIMFFGGVMFLTGSIINAAAVNIAMLIIGRMLLGFGLGFTLQSAPVYLSETAPARWRGAFTSAYNAFVVVGILSATITNYLTNRIPGWGWRVSLGLAAVPGTIIVVGSLFIPDTPSSLVLRGHPEKARAALQHIRGAGADVDAEFKDIVRAVDEARQNEAGAFRRLFSKPYRHCLAVGLGIPLFYEFTGMMGIAIFSPVLFRTVGFSSQKAILGSVINSMTNLASTLLSTSVMDRTGRRPLFIVGGLGMMLCEVAISWIFADHLGKHQGVTVMPRSYATGVLVLICACTFCFGLSWAPLRWVVPSEIYPVEVRSAGQAVSISVALCLSFVELQVFIALLCALKYGVFLFFAGWLLTMTVFVAVFLPETKGVPIEAMRSVWAGHCYWKRFVNDADQKDGRVVDEGTD